MSHNLWAVLARSIYMAFYTSSKRAEEKAKAEQEAKEKEGAQAPERGTGEVGKDSGTQGDHGH